MRRSVLSFLMLNFLLGTMGRLNSNLISTIIVKPLTIITLNRSIIIVVP